jgi:hypothetical protein
MCISKPAVEANSHSSARRALVREKHVRQQHATTAAQLNNALAREEALLCEKSDLLRRHEMMAQEFEHRLFNSLRLIVSLLWLQSRAASTPEAATQLSIAADRVAAFGTRAPAAACARSSGESGVQAIYPSPVRGPFGFALPGRSESRHRGGVWMSRYRQHSASRWGLSSTSSSPIRQNTPKAPSPFDWERRRPIIIGYRCRTTDLDCRRSSILSAAGDSE